MQQSKVDNFADIAASLDVMEKRKEVDLAVLGKIDSLNRIMHKSEQFWLKNVDAVPVDAFILYHAFRNMRSVLDTFRERFVTAADNHDNPKVVDDAKLVLPSLFTLFATVDQMEPQVFTRGLRSHVLGKIRDMRRAASRARMLPSDSEGVPVKEAEVDLQTKNLAETFRELFARDV